MSKRSMLPIAVLVTLIGFTARSWVLSFLPAVNAMERFTPPDEKQRRSAIGPTTGLPKTLQRAFDSADHFEPIPAPGPSDWLANHAEPGQTFEQYRRERVRIPWSYVEPIEGRYNWSLPDTPAQRWIAKGKQVAFRISCCESWTRWATPQWVADAGAKGYNFRPGAGVKGRDSTVYVGLWSPARQGTRNHEERLLPDTGEADRRVLVGRLHVDEAGQPKLETTP